MEAPINDDEKEQILNNAGPRFFEKIEVNPVFMAQLVKRDVMSHYQSADILALPMPSSKKQKLLEHLYEGSVQQFVDFCITLSDVLQCPDIINDVFGLDINQLRKQTDTTMETGEELPSTGTLSAAPTQPHRTGGPETSAQGATATSLSEHQTSMCESGLGSAHQTVKNKDEGNLDTCAAIDHTTGGKNIEETRSVKTDVHDVSIEEPVILSILGYYKKDQDGIFLLGSLLSEQIKEQLPKATVLHVVLDDHKRIVADHQETDYIGFIKPGGLPEEDKPSTKWLNYYYKTFYPHLGKYKVSHIITPTPDFIWGAINLKLDLFPESRILTMIHDQINIIERHQLQELEIWTKSVEALVSLGQDIYDDVENLLCCFEDDVQCEKKLCYLPGPPKHFRHCRPWKKPPNNLNPVVTILASDIETQESQKMALPIIVRAITSVAEDLHRVKSVRRLAVRITGVPRNESNMVKENLKIHTNDFISLECVEAFSFTELEREMKRSYLCIIPLGSHTLAYGLDFMFPAGFGAPCLVPDSAPILQDFRDIVSGCDHIHLEKVTVEVKHARTIDAEKMAWAAKIKSVLTHIEQAQQSALALRQAIEESSVLARNRHDFIKLLKVPPKQVPLPQAIEQPMSDACSTYENESTKVQRPFLVEKPPYYYPDGYHKVSSSSDEEIIKPINKMARLQSNWVLICTLISPYPLVDTMLAQGSISRAVFDEVYSTEEKCSEYAAMNVLLKLVRRRGEQGIDQLCNALRDPIVAYDVIAERIEGKQKPLENYSKCDH